MKKSLAFCLAITLMISALAGCGQSGESFAAEESNAGGMAAQEATSTENEIVSSGEPSTEAVSGESLTYMKQERFR